MANANPNPNPAPEPAPVPAPEPAPEPGPEPNPSLDPEPNPHPHQVRRKSAEFDEFDDVDDYELPSPGPSAREAAALAAQVAGHTWLTLALALTLTLIRTLTLTPTLTQASFRSAMSELATQTEANQALTAEVRYPVITPYRP